MRTFIALSALAALTVVLTMMGAWIFMMLWNFAITPVFGIHALSFAQSIALVFLLGIIANMFRK